MKPSTLASLLFVGILAGTLGASVTRAALDAPPTVEIAREAPPRWLHETGLYEAGTNRVRVEHLAFTPQYPLWTDGLRKRRWLYLPAGTAVDATDPDAWRFPPGTKLWKEFGTDRPLETRVIERLADGSWRFATYVWNADGTAAELAPEDGTAVVARGLPGDRHLVPGRGDCLACHDAGAGPVLGVSALQLSPERDPLALHAGEAAREPADLRTLVAAGRLRNLPPRLLADPPRIAATSPTARAALGYLHGNCGHCHNDAGPLATLDLSLAQRAATPGHSAGRTLDTLLGRASRFRPHDGAATARVAAGAGERSVLAMRMRSSNPYARMPPLGVQVVDRDGVALVERWIRDEVGRPDPGRQRLSAR